MKKHFALLSILVFVASLAMAQSFDAPKKGAKIYAQEYVINIDADSNTSFDLWIVRAKTAKKAKFLAPTLNSSSGLTFEIAQDAENQDHFLVTVAANKVAVGQYTVIVSSRSNGTQKVTGTTLSFNVLASKAVASEDGE
ncbi:hypothetical protein [Ekhidna sp.]|uniref:hypothetical protein n=1 Tax=Ekhidna sp. TaxID=2608089 RepID=UPI00329935C9